MKNISFRNDVLPMKNELFRLALRITRNAQEAEDVVQETLIKVWDRRDSWHLIDNIEAFCMTTCRNMSIDRCRKLDNSHLSLRQEIVQIPSGGNNPLEHTAVSDKVEQVRLLIASLSEKQRTCLHLRDFEGKSYREISQIMSITEEQVKVSIFRARQTIKQKFQKIDEYGL